MNIKEDCEVWNRRQISQFDYSLEMKDGQPQTP